MRLIYFIVLLFSLTSCFDLISYNYWSDGDYYVTDNSGISDIKTLYIKTGRDNGHGRVDYVDAIGSNENFIIVSSSFQKKQYWILNKRKDHHHLNSDEIVEGPLTYSEFKSRKKELKISALNFSKRW